MPRDTMFDRAPVTARRFLDLYDKGGDDDMFSSDLTDEVRAGEGAERMRFWNGPALGFDSVEVLWIDDAALASCRSCESVWVT